MMKIKLSFDGIFLFVLSFLAIGSLGSFFGLGRYNIFPTKLIFELFVFFVLVSKLIVGELKLRNDLSALFYLLSCYFLLTFVYFLGSDQVGTIYDFLMAYKVVIYMVVSVFFVGRRTISKDGIINVFYVLAIAMLIKYVLSIFMGYSERPGLYDENNFELMLLIFSFYSKFILENKIKKFDLVIVLSIFILSGSRSGIISVIPFLFFIDTRKFGVNTLSKVILLIFVSVLAMFIFLDRMANISIYEIDRVRFLFVFLSEIENWNFINYVFGTEPLTPLSYSGALDLTYYKGLFSNHDKNITFSVVLHSFLLRAIFDHGLLGLWVIIFFYFKILFLSGFTRNECFAILGVLLMNSLSVSSLNSVFSILGIMLLCSASASASASEDRK